MVARGVTAAWRRAGGSCDAATSPPHAPVPDPDAQADQVAHGLAHTDQVKLADAPRAWAADCVCGSATPSLAAVRAITTHACGVAHSPSAARSQITKSHTKTKSVVRAHEHGGTVGAELLPGPGARVNPQGLARPPIRLLSRIPPPPPVSTDEDGDEVPHADTNSDALAHGDAHAVTDA